MMNHLLTVTPDDYSIINTALYYLRSAEKACQHLEEVENIERVIDSLADQVHDQVAADLWGKINSKGVK